jgi:hypothetical protein
VADLDFEVDEFDADSALDRIDVLVGQLLEETLPEAEFHELESMLLASENARQKYVGLMHLHFDLMAHFQPSLSPIKPKSPVLAFLSESLPPSTGLPSTGLSHNTPS